MRIRLLSFSNCCDHPFGNALLFTLQDVLWAEFSKYGPVLLSCLITSAGVRGLRATCRFKTSTFATTARSSGACVGPGCWLLAQCCVRVGPYRNVWSIFLFPLKTQETQ